MDHRARIFVLLLLAGITCVPCAAQTTADSATTRTIVLPDNPVRAARPIGFKLGLAGIGRKDHLGVQADAVLFNRVGLELGTNIDVTGFRARYYLLPMGSSPFAGLGAGISYENGLLSGDWKEFHVGFEHAFSNGLVLQIQYTRIFDKHGPGNLRYTLTPAVGFRL